MIKQSIHQKEIKIINVYSPNNIAPKYIKQTLTELKGEIGNSAKIVGVFNNPLSIMNRAPRQKFNKEQKT